MKKSITKLVKQNEAVKWQKQKGIISFDVISDGRSAKEWAKLWKGSPLTVNYLLSSGNFKPTDGKIYHIVIVKSPILANIDKSFKNGMVLFEKYEFVDFEASLLISDKIKESDVRKMGYDKIEIIFERLKDNEWDRHSLKTHSICGCESEIKRVGWALSVTKK